MNKFRVIKIFFLYQRIPRANNNKLDVKPDHVDYFIFAISDCSHSSQSELYQLLNTGISPVTLR